MSSFDKITKSYLYSLGGKLADFMILSVLWLIFSIPVVTMGASSAALYYAINRRFAHKSEAAASDFMHSFKQNLKQGTLLTLIYLGYGSILAFDIYAARNGINGSTLPEIYEQIAYVLILPIAFTLPYVFAYLSRFDNTVKEILRHCFFFCATHLLHTIAILLLVLTSGAAMFFFPPCALVVPAVCAYLCSIYIEKDFRQALVLRDKRDEDDDGKPSLDTPDEDEIGRHASVEADISTEHSVEDRRSNEY
jgi:uncharacterized membrane protein YesL